MSSPNRTRTCIWSLGNFRSIPWTIGPNRPIRSDHGLFNNLPSAIISAFGAYPVVHNCCAAIRTGSQCGSCQFIVRSAFVSSLFWDPVFWMCHISIVIYCYCFIKSFNVAKEPPPSALWSGACLCFHKRNIPGSQSFSKVWTLCMGIARHTLSYTYCEKS